MIDYGKRQTLFVYLANLTDRKITLKKTLTYTLKECKQNHFKSLVSVT